MNQNNPTKTLLGIKFFAFALFPLFALGVAVSLGLAQSESAQSPILTPIPCPSCTSPTPTATPSCSCKPTPTATPPLNTPLNDLGPGTYTRRVSKAASILMVRISGRWTMTLQVKPSPRPSHRAAQTAARPHRLKMAK